MADNVTFNLRLPFGMKVSAVRRMVSTPLTGMLHRRQTNKSTSPNFSGSTQRQDFRQYEVTWDGLKASEATELVSMYESAFGGAVPIDLPSPPEESADVPDTIPCFITDDSLVLRRDSAARYFARLKFREAF